MTGSAPRSRPRPILSPSAAGWAIVSGGLFGASVRVEALGLLACVAWVPLLTVWSRSSPRRMAVAAFLSWLTAAVTGFSWVLGHAVPTAALASAGGLLVWAFFFSLPWPVAVAVRRQWGRSAGLAALLALHLCVEGLLSRGPGAFPWGLQGHALAPVSWVRPLAAVGGVPALSAWVAAVNAAAFAAWRAPHTWRQWGPSLMALAALPLAAASLPGEPPSAPAQTVLLVQPGTPPTAWADVRSPERLHRLQQQTEAALDTSARRPSVVIWPETALPAPRTLDREQRMIRSLQTWVDSLGIALVTGGIGIAAERRGRTSRPSGLPAYTNRVWFLSPRDSLSIAGAGSPASTGASSSARSPDDRLPDDPAYDKVHLVPFAEHVPYADALPLLRTLNVAAGGVSQYRRGDGPVVWPTAAGPAAPLVCMESVVVPHARSAVRRGASWLITVAQTGWWGDSAAPRQHLAFSRLTAVATGRPVVIAAVQGPSAVIRPNGRVAGRTAFGATDVQRVFVSPASTTPPSVWLGDWIFWLAGPAGTGVLIALAWRRIRRGRRPVRPS